MSGAPGAAAVSWQGDDGSGSTGQATDQPVATLELVHAFEGPMPTGVTVSARGRVFVNYPLWGDDVPATVTELRDGVAVPYPDEAWNSPSGDDDAGAFVSVQSVVVDPADRLWVLDTGSPLFQPTKPGGPKLVCVDLATDEVVQVITFDPSVALPSTYLNDVRFDLRRGEAGTAFITDSSDTGPNAIVVVDLATGESWRRLHEHPSTKALPWQELRPVVEGRPLVQQPSPDEDPQPVAMGADGIAISHDGERLLYCPLASRRLWSVSVDALVDRALDDAAVAATVVDEGDKGTGADGLETDDRGRIYVTSYEHDAVLRRLPDGSYETLVHDPRLLWPDTMSVAADGHLYVTANQLHRQATYQRGEDLRTKPYALFRTPIDAGPVRLVREGAGGSGAAAGAASGAGGSGGPVPSGPA
ncbi:L-dopachrome tautomerase-related protein [Cellulomonas sp. 179-A 4D5 NHS]|uniref:L-dopachrome tautomerase-related protein n=1 Tax=Cellulomonas sp. 179-A 4D5 NHS TaxID=3142378 RepID=UPI0039A1A71C